MSEKVHHQLGNLTVQIQSVNLLLRHNLSQRLSESIEILMPLCVFL